jgi:hypothetical protein
MQPNEMNLANMAQLAKANSTNQDPQLQGSTPGTQAPGLPLKGAIGATPTNAGPTAAGPTNAGPTAAGPAATPTPSPGIIAGQMLAGRRG